MNKRIDEDKINTIMMLRACGYTQKEIANKLGVSQTTVAYHLRMLRMMAEKEGVERVFAKLVGKILGKMIVGGLNVDINKKKEFR